MTNNPTIDGVLVPRRLAESLTKCWFNDEARAELRALLSAPTNDLREHCKQCAEVVKTWPEWKQNSLGGAPAVERQEPFAWFTEDYLNDKSSTTYDELTSNRWKAKGWPVQPLFAAPPAPVVPEGWKLVPVDLTSRMLEAGKDERMDCFTNPSLSVQGALIRIYSAIIDAAPACLDATAALNGERK